MTKRINKIHPILLVLISFALISIIILLLKQNETISELVNYYEPLKIVENAFIFEEISITGEKITNKNISTLMIFF